MRGLAGSISDLPASEQSFPHRLRSRYNAHMKKPKRDFLSITDISAREFGEILSLASTLKKQLRRTGKNTPLLAGKTLIQIYEKPSLRTHASFDIGMFQLGGHALYFGPEHIGLGKREPVKHAANVLSRMADILMARVFEHATVAELARHSGVPVINGLSDLEHPCQVLADIMTIAEHKGTLKGLKLAYAGDCDNNVTHSLALAAGMLGIHFVAASPSGYRMKPEIVTQARHSAKGHASGIIELNDPREAVRGADIVYTDTWVSMGAEKEKKQRQNALKSYQVNAALMKLAKPDAIFMHDMPAYLGYEVTEEVFDSPQSVAYDQAENRLHAQKGLLAWLPGASGAYGVQGGVSCIRNGSGRAPPCACGTCTTGT